MQGQMDIYQPLSYLSLLICFRYDCPVRVGDDAATFWVRLHEPCMQAVKHPTSAAVQMREVIGQAATQLVVTSAHVALRIGALCEARDGIIENCHMI